MELSRVEHILKYFLGEEATLPQPLSRVEELLIALGELIEEGKVTNPISIRGRVNTVGDLPSDAEPGWLYFVGLATDTEFTEYIYLDSGRWEYLGTSMISIDTTLSTTSTNPVQNSTITNALNKKPGEITTGKQYVIDGQTVTAGSGAEAFNDLTGNKAAGSYSHAEGQSTTASGPLSHAEGQNTTASAPVSHAEGYNTKASGVQSHAEGIGTTASGDVSHAEGSSTTASGAQSHAEGSSTTASGAQSHAEGSSTTASGQFSHAEGLGTTASSPVSHAEGGNTKASAPCSHAEGNGTKASSESQHVQGKYNVEDVNGYFAFIIGNGTADNARHNAFAVDWNGLIYVNGAPIGVDLTKKPGEITTGKQYVIDGQTVTAGVGAEAFNDLANNKAAGGYSHAEGYATTASGSVSHAEGSGVIASGSISHAEGYNTKAFGTYSHAEGYAANASGYCSHAEGVGTTASGSGSHTEGGGTIASGTNSHSEGLNTKASSANQHVQGKYNVEDANGTYAFIIGNGTADNARHNAFAVDWNGLIYVNGAATGVNVSTLPTSEDLNGKVNTSDVITTAEIDEMFE